MGSPARFGRRGCHPDRAAPGRGFQLSCPGNRLEPADSDAVTAQLGRPPRSALGVAHRCPCGHPDVVATAPRLADGTPFPTMFYLTCPTASSAIGTLEAGGVMRAMNDRLAAEPDLAAAQLAAHEDYLARRAAVEDVAEIAGISAGGMPMRVKCLHVLAGHALAAGPGVNPLGDEVLAALGPWWTRHPCLPRAPRPPHILGTSDD